MKTATVIPIIGRALLVGAVFIFAAAARAQTAATGTIEGRVVNSRNGDYVALLLDDREFACPAGSFIFIPNSLKNFFAHRTSGKVFICGNYELFSGHMRRSWT